MKETKNEEMKFYRLDNILEKAPNSCYYFIYGERSNGKSFAVLEYILKQYLLNGSEGAVIRRWKIDFQGGRGHTTFANLECDKFGVNHVKELTGGKYSRIIYRNSRWFLGNYDEEQDKMITAPDPFCYAFALSDYEHDKSTSYPRVKNVLFDEYCPKTGGLYLVDEYVTYMQVLSTIIRHKGDVKVFMCANSLDRYCLYYREFGLVKGIVKQKKGTIDIYNYGDSELQVAVEYSDSPSDTKPSDKYFAFDNPALKVITTGEWSFSIYPHLLRKYEEKDVIFRYFIIYEEEILQCNIVCRDNEAFTFIHHKTTPIKDEDNDIIFCCDQEQKANYLTKITRPTTKIGRQILSFFTNNKVFYQSNEVGDLVEHYLNWCKQG